MEQHGDTVGTGYPQAQLAKAVTGGDTGKAARWRAVIAGMLRGDLTIGSRTPVRKMPAWVTPEVLHGGFASGRAAAAGPLNEAETAYADRHGLPHDRGVIFRHRIDPARRARLDALLDDGYAVTLPEEALLPVVAWLLRFGDEEAALDLIEQVLPYSAALCFTPRPAPGPPADPELVWRATAGEARQSLANRQPNERVEAMRGTLGVWNLYADRVLAHWLRSAVDGRVGVHMDEPWQHAARGLLAEYADLARRTPPSRRHAGPKANLTVLRTALEEAVAGREWRRGLVQTVTDAMVRRRGEPGSPGHAALPDRLAAVAAKTPHHVIARQVAERLAELPQHIGVLDAEPLVAGAPASVRAVVRRATAAPVEGLVAAGLVPSAEVLAALVPRVTAQAVGAAYADPDLRALMAAHYLAFRNRRSLLLTDLESQVRPDELPWVRAVQRYELNELHELYDGSTEAGAAVALRRIGGLTLCSFPGTLLPNPLVSELRTLSREARLRLPWVEELAADIFDGRFVAKFPAAARLAGNLLAGTLYERYYRIDYAYLDALPAPQGGKAVSPEFARLCRERAGVRQATGRPAHNGMIIEQAQILTTHNLATLVHGAGVAVDPLDAATGAWTTVERLASRPLSHRSIKDIAYAWRHMIFFLSLTGDSLTGDALTFVEALPRHGRLGPAVDGLWSVLAGRKSRPLTGWTTERHWLLAPGVDQG
ncbi:hypothetical protein [Actinoplanes utahensis]|uniref:hypothetical protein n=1 Tax=Actinoplanes utahensis TaxID=1869 RepID=UPI0031E95158